MAKQLTAEDIQRLARRGAAERLAELEREIAALKRAFPGLKARVAPPVRTPDAAQPPAAAPPARSRSRRSPMSAAERKAVSERMKRYWDARRKDAGKPAG